MPQPHPTEVPRVPLGADGPLVSRAGFGCYRVDDRSPVHREALRLALLSGVNLVDTSTNYGDGHSELLVGQVVAELAGSGEVPRDGVVVVTKAGYVQGGNLREALRRQREGNAWPEMTEYARDCWHCVSPAFLGDQLTASLGRLRMPRVDVLLLHNPEYFLMDAAHRGVPLGEARDVFYDRLARAFAHLEREVASGRIGAYGISSNTLVVPHESPDAVDLLRATAAAGPGFRVVQLPMNPLELGAREPIHTVDGRSVLDVARERELGVLVNRPFNAFRGGRLARFARVEPPVPLVPDPPPDAREALRALEAEWARSYAPRLSAGQGSEPPESFFSVSPLLQEIERRGVDLAAVRDVWASTVAPRLEELLPQLRQLLARDSAFGAWADAFERRLGEAASAVLAPLVAREEKRAAELEETVTAAFHGARGGTLSQRTLRGLLETPGVTSVLVGMRRPEYVGDVVGGLAEAGP